MKEEQFLLSKETNLEFKGLHEKVSDPKYSFYEEMVEKYRHRFTIGFFIVVPLLFILTAVLIIVTIFTEAYPVIVVPVYGILMCGVFIFIYSSSSIKIKDVRKLLLSKNSDSLLETAYSSKRDSKTAFAIYALIDIGEEKVEEIILQEEIDSYYFRFQEDFLYAREVYAIIRGFKSFNELESKK